MARDDYVKRWGVWWSKLKEPAAVHLDCITHGGEWINSHTGETCGGGMVFHYKELIKVLWPEIVMHRWLELILENYLTHRLIVLIGPASSSKTFSSALLVLIDYFAHPDCTTVICCSTTKERLQERVWADVTKLFKNARKVAPWLPGNIIEGRLRIVTDNRKESPDGRDFRNGCFPTGTLVDTPIGKRPIEDLKVGDLVCNAIGVGKIKDTHARKANQLIRVTLSDGRFIDCTDEHPFFTQRGWVKAIDLTTSEMVLSACETMRLLREDSCRSLSKQEILLPCVPDFSACKDKVQPLRRSFPTIEKSTWFILRKILQSELRLPMGIETQAMPFQNQETMSSLQQAYAASPFQQGLLLGAMQKQTGNITVQAMRSCIPFNSRIPSKETFSFLQYFLPEKSHRETVFTKTSQSNSGGNESLEIIPEFDLSSSYKYWINDKTQPQALVPSGHSISEPEIGSRNRRWNSQDSRQGKERQTENANTGIAWVDSVEILESDCDKRFEKSTGGYQVHNLSVDGHPSYSVNGVIVHNCVGVPCKRGDNFVGLSDFAGIKNKRVRLLGDELSLLPRAFCDAISNLDKNPDFKCIGLGNPKDTTDALGVLGEPAAHLGGWESGIDKTFGTKTWEVRRSGGICIQLPGDDSPNLDGKLGIPLISQADMDRDVSFYGKESIWFTMMDLGQLPRGAGNRRVLTRQLCEQMRAMEQPVWRDSNLKRIAFMDAGYGGDRCIFGELVFGYESVTQNTFVPDASGIAASVTAPNNPHQIIALVDTVVVPVNPGLDVLPEEQIVRFVMKQCEARGIPPENFFYESGMRTELVQTFGRLWSSQVESVDCMGKAGEGPVSTDIQKPCHEYYANKITEIWYSVRLVVEAGQFRGMLDRVLQEFCDREWTIVAGNKIQVETKERLKLKCGRSPDEADATAIGIFGARRRGFQIARLQPAKPLNRGPDWRSELREKARKVWGEGQLEYASG